MNQIGLVILNYNTYQDTIRLVGELQCQTVADKLHIVVVDNASPNGSFDKLRCLEQEYPNVVVLQTGENLGYAKGNNFGLHYLDSHVNPRYVAILNNDVILPDDCLGTLCAKYKKLESPCIIAPLQLDEMGRKTSSFINLRGYWEDVKALSMVYSFIRKNNNVAWHDNTGQNAMRVDIVSGSFMFADFERFKEIGFFYPNTFLYVEERFVAHAAKKVGYKNYVILDQSYIHAHNSPTINSIYNQVEKYKILYRSIIEYTRVCRKKGKMKAAIMMSLMFLSLLEIRIVLFVKNIFSERQQHN